MAYDWNETIEVHKITSAYYIFNRQRSFQSKITDSFERNVALENVFEMTIDVLKCYKYDRSILRGLI